MVNRRGGASYAVVRLAMFAVPVFASGASRIFSALLRTVNTLTMQLDSSEGTRTKEEDEEEEQEKEQEQEQKQEQEQEQEQEKEEAEGLKVSVKVPAAWPAAAAAGADGSAASVSKGHPATAGRMRRMSFSLRESKSVKHVVFYHPTMAGVAKSMSVWAWRVGSGPFARVSFLLCHFMRHHGTRDARMSC